MYYYLNQNKEVIFIRSEDTLKNLIQENIITSETQIKIGLRGQFSKASEVQEIQNFFNSNTTTEEVIEKNNTEPEIILDTQDIHSENTDKIDIIIDDQLLDENVTSDFKNSETINSDNQISSKEMNEAAENSFEEDENNEVNKSEKRNIVPEIQIIKEDHHLIQEGTYKVNMADAIKLAFKNAFNFKDRSSRSEYWFFYLFNCLLYIPVFVLDGTIGSNETFSLIYGIVFGFISLSLNVRRIHDINRSGWWMLLILTGLGSIVIFIFNLIEGDKISNRFGKCSLGALKKS